VLPLLCLLLCLLLLVCLLLLLVQLTRRFECGRGLLVLRGRRYGQGRHIRENSLLPLRLPAAALWLLLCWRRRRQFMLLPCLLLVVAADSNRGWSLQEKLWQRRQLRLRRRRLLLLLWCWLRCGQHIPLPPAPQQRCPHSARQEGEGMLTC
jgi:hypothetical protein